MTNKKHFRAIALVAVMCFGAALFIVDARNVSAQQAGALLSGAVKSDSSGKLEGVTVSAKALGQTITTSVFHR